MPTDIHRTNLRFLLTLKGAVGILNNLIHDNLALMAIAQFKENHPQLTCAYNNAGASGIDIQGMDDAGNLQLFAEVKTSLPDKKTKRIRGPQLTAIKKDLDRLAKQREDVPRYLVLLSRSTKEAVEKQLKTGAKYPKITIIDAFVEEFLEGEDDAPE